VSSALRLPLSSAQDKDVAFIILKASSAPSVKKAVQVAAEVKRKRLRVNREELHQYVVEPEADTKRITFGKKSYSSPTCLQIYLSRFQLDELQPKAKPKPAARR
jgi:hypothetical protein